MELLNFIITAAQDQTIIKNQHCSLLHFIDVQTAAQDQTIIIKQKLKVHSCMDESHHQTAGPRSNNHKKTSTKGSFLYGTELLNFNITAAQDQTIIKKTALKVHSCMVLLNFIITAAQDQTIIKKQH